MKPKKQKKSNWIRIVNSYITTTFSITLLLFLLGIISLLYLSSSQINNYVKENISFSVFIKEDAKEVDILKLQKMLDAKPYVKSTCYITKDMAAEQMKKDLGESFLELLSENPLPPSIEVKYKADYAVPDSIKKIEKEISQYPIVEEMYYQKDLVYIIYKNINTISFFVLLISLFLLVVAVALINNTIRLLIYSKRFLIKTMQLVGATKSFIRAPYVAKSLYQGIIASFIAMALITAVVYFLQLQLGDMINLYDIRVLGITYLVILFTGIIICLLSSFFAVNRYLRLRTADLYF
ncbi:MAG TPA: permease-like cell division protein FtsX [Bacteroidales bacterium]|jgi:cell division transport system permease protein|nr:permease-like cell division protein FtsX [Bacteroidales bacterium]HOU97420.1 permease-like cell division protein FtsX [Bacteroidales bacterium]